MTASLKGVLMRKLILKASIAACIGMPLMAQAMTLEQANILVTKVTDGHLKASKILNIEGAEAVVVNPVVPNPKVKGFLLWIDGNALVQGGAVNNSGPLNQKAMVEAGLAQPPMTPAQQTAFAVKSTHTTYVHVGTKGPVLWAYIDPNCIFCHKLYGTIMPRVNAGKMQVNFIPVGFLHPDSAAKAQAILASKNPAGAIAYNEQHFIVKTESGGVKPDMKTPKNAVDEVASNTKLLASSGELATPTLFYKRKGVWHLVQGLNQGFISKFLAK
jgi:thiol:disulfide interchange protein DsbG